MQLFVGIMLGIFLAHSQFKFEIVLCIRSIVGLGSKGKTWLELHNVIGTTWREQEDVRGETWQEHQHVSGGGRISTIYGALKGDYGRIATLHRLDA